MPATNTPVAAPASSSPTAGEAAPAAVPSDAEAKEFGYAIGNSVVRRYAVSDVHTARKALNDNISAYLEEERGGQRHMRYTDTRLLFGTLSIIVGAASHLTPIPFPESYWFIIGCIIVYYILTMVMMYIGRWLEADAFSILTFYPPKAAASPASAAAKRGKGAAPAAKGSKGAGKMVSLTSHVERFQPTYKLRAQLVKPAAFPLFAATPIGAPVEREYFFGTFFTERGLVYPPAVRVEMDKLLADLKIDS